MLEIQSNTSKLNQDTVNLFAKFLSDREVIKTVDSMQRFAYHLCTLFISPDAILWTYFNQHYHKHDDFDLTKTVQVIQYLVHRAVEITLLEIEPQLAKSYLESKSMPHLESKKNPVDYLFTSQDVVETKQLVTCLKQEFDPLTFIYYMMQLRFIPNSEYPFFGLPKSSRAEIALELAQFILNRSRIRNTWVLNDVQFYLQGSQELVTSNTDQDFFVNDILHRLIRRNLLSHSVLLWMSANRHISLQHVVTYLLDPMPKVELFTLLSCQPQSTSVFELAAWVVFMASTYDSTSLLQRIAKQDPQDSIFQNVKSLASLFQTWQPNEDRWSFFIMSFLPADVYKIDRSTFISSTNEATLGLLESLDDMPVMTTKANTNANANANQNQPDQKRTELFLETLYQSMNTISHIIIFFSSSMRFSESLRTTVNSKTIRAILTAHSGSILQDMKSELKSWCEIDANESDLFCKDLTNKLAALKTETVTFGFRQEELTKFIDFWISYEQYVVKRALQLKDSEFVAQYKQISESLKQFSLREKGLRLQKRSVELEIGKFSQKQITDLDDSIDEMETESRNLQVQLFYKAVLILRNPKYKPRLQNGILKYIQTSRYVNPNTCTNWLGKITNCSLHEQEKRKAMNTAALKQYPQEFQQLIEAIGKDERMYFLPEAFATTK